MAPTDAESALSELHLSQRRRLLHDLARLQDRLDGINLDDDLHDGDLHDVACAIRAGYGLVAGFQGSLDWHSPALWSTQARDRDPRGGATDHDYRRDRCPIVADFEQAWLTEYVSVAAPSTGSPPVDPHSTLSALAFVSGMAAINTIITMLAAERGRFHVVDTVYHETRFLLTNSEVCRRVQWIETGGTAGDPVMAVVDSLADDGEGAVIIVDSQINGPTLEVTDWRRLLRLLAARRSPTTLMMDVTMTSAIAQPFRHRPPSARLRLIVVESLTKLTQFGQDRVAAGMVVTDRDTAGIVDKWREHMGSTASAATIRQLPSPSRKTLIDRLERIRANGSQLAAHLDRPLATCGIRVVHPTLPGRPGFRRDPGGDSGPMVVLTGWSKSRLDHLVDRITAASTEVAAPIAVGTSFGFDTTRIAVITPYPPGPLPYQQKPDAEPAAYIRVAVGSGSAAEIERAAELIIGAVRTATVQAHRRRVRPAERSRVGASGASNHA